MSILAVFKKSFLQFYENLFKLVFFNIVWFIIVTIPFFIGYIFLRSGWALPLILPLTLTGPVFMAGLQLINRLVLREEALIRDFFKDILKFFKKGFLSFIFSAVIYFIILMDILFFLERGKDSIFMLIISVIFLYLFIFFSMMQLFFWGLTTIRADLGMIKVIKQSFLLTLDNALFAFIYFICFVIIVVILFITGIGLPLLLLGLVGLFIINGTRYILKKYE